MCARIFENSNHAQVSKLKCSRQRIRPCIIVGHETTKSINSRHNTTVKRIERKYGAYIYLVGKNVFDFDEGYEHDDDCIDIADGLCIITGIKNNLEQPFGIICG